MQKTKIEWVRNPDGSQGYSWNPITGMCPQACWYCYARKIYKRFHKEEFNGILPAGKPWMSVEREADPLKYKKSCGIFVCSTMELFHLEIYDSWRYRIFKVIKQCPQHRFYILTKCPENIDRPMPDNVWLGITAEYTFRAHLKIDYSEFMNSNIKAKVKFASFEPLILPIDLYEISYAGRLDWIIIGRLTGFGRKYDPKREWIEKIIEQARKYNIPVFLKNNLKEIWGEKLIQEFPKVN